jgi:hypothetical protein
VKRILPLLFISLGLQSPALSNTTSTANPIANSSGSVQNVGVMNMPTRQFQNQVGLNTVVCQGDTLVVQPFLTTGFSATRPYQSSFQDPIYSTRDIEGTTDADGNVIGDGDADNPGQVIGYRTVRTAQKDNYSISPGISVSWNIQLDRKSVNTCRQAQKRQSDLILAKLNDQKIAVELGRLKTCGDLMTKGYRFKPGTKYAILCADVELVSAPNTLIDHQHSISSTVANPSSGGND